MIYRLFVIAKNNIKKQKGDMFTFFILTFLAAFLVFDCACAMLGMGRILNERFREINGAHVIIFNKDSEAETDSAERAIREDPHIVDYERTPTLQFEADYRKKGAKDYSVFSFFAESIGEEKRIMKVDIPDREYQKNDILLPYHLKASFAVGDIMQIRFGEDVIDFRVVGYLEDPFFCSTMNITTFYVNITKEMMEELAQEYPLYVAKGYAHKGIADEKTLTDGYGTRRLEEDVAERYKGYVSEYSAKDPGSNYTQYMLVNWEMIRGGSQFFPSIVMAILLLFAFLILLISLVIISFSVKNFIQRNMKNTGILEASGYTVKELRLSLMLQLLLVAALGSGMGIGSAMLTFGRFGDVVSAVLGLSWNQPINWVAAALTFSGLLLVMAIVGMTISGVYKKISVLDALRGGISTHNFKRNFFPLEKTNLPLPWVLSLKDTFGGFGRNLLMVFISMFLVIFTLIGFGMVENFAKNPDGLMKMLAFEMGTDQVTASQCNRDISEELRSLSSVENVLINVGFEPTVIFGEQKSMIYTYAVDDLNNTRNTNLMEGRYPEKENEILVTLGVAKDLGVKVGDVVEIEFAGKKADYIITGINQRMERMGRTIYMRIDGAMQIIPGDIIPAYQYFVTAKEGITYEELKAEIDEYAKKEGLELQQSDMYTSIDSTIATVVVALNAICAVVVVITIIIVIFVESLVIRAKINRDWRGMGISKALGQTSGGLITQIMLSNVPAILAGAILGGMLAPFAGGSMIKTAFSLFAVRQIDFNIPVYYILLTIIGIIAVAVFTAATAGLKVRKLKPVTMITEE